MLYIAPYSHSQERPIPPRPSDADLLLSLREGSEAAFNALLECHCDALFRLAMSFVSTRAAAEEVVQETWLAVLTGLSRFQGRSSLKTWIFRILVNRAITRCNRDSRSIPFSSLNRPELPVLIEVHNPSKPHLASGSLSFQRDTPEEMLIRKETRFAIKEALELLPKRQREVVALRDVQGWTSKEVCKALTISEANQRVLLHRGRLKLRKVLQSQIDFS